MYQVPLNTYEALTRCNGSRDRLSELYLPAPENLFEPLQNGNGNLHLPSARTFSLNPELEVQTQRA